MDDFKLSLLATRKDFEPPVIQRLIVECSSEPLRIFLSTPCRPVGLSTPTRSAQWREKRRESRRKGVNWTPQEIDSKSGPSRYYLYLQGSDYLFPERHSCCADVSAPNADSRVDDIRIPLPRRRRKGRSVCDLSPFRLSR